MYGDCLISNCLIGPIDDCICLSAIGLVIKFSEELVLLFTVVPVSDGAPGAQQMINKRMPNKRSNGAVHFIDVSLLESIQAS